MFNNGKIEEILLKYNCPRRINHSSTTIEQIENLVKFKIPLDYKVYLQNYLGFEEFIGSKFMHLWDLDEIIEFNNYGIVEKLPNTLGIGSNASSEFIALELTEDGNCRVVISPFIGLDKQDHIEIGTSFTDF